MSKTTDTSALSLLVCDEGFDPIEDRLRAMNQTGFTGEVGVDHSAAMLAVSSAL